VWPLETDSAPVYRLHSERAMGICICPDGLTAVSVGWDRSVKQFDIATGQVLRSAATQEQAWSVALAADGRTALVGEGHGACEMLDLARFTLTPVKLSEMGVPQRLADPNATAPAAAPATAPANYSDTITTVAIAAEGGSALAGGADRMFSIFPL